MGLSLFKANHCRRHPGHEARAQRARGGGVGGRVPRAVASAASPHHLGVPTVSRIATMARFRRMYVARRRRPVYRRRSRPGRPYRRRLRRKKTPTLYVKLTRTVQITVPSATEYNYALHVTLNDFAEHINLAASFERVKVLRQTVRVYPQQNVSNTSTSRVGNYCLLPYHKPAPTTAINFPTALSIDKAKIYRGTAKGRMSFVPAARVDVDATGTPASQTVQTSWRPEFEISAGPTLPILYTGMLVVENIGITVPPVVSYYTLVQDLYVRYKNQRSFI